MAEDNNSKEEKKKSASDIAFIIFLILFLICVAALCFMTIGMSEGAWSKRLLNNVGTKLGMIADFLLCRKASGER